MKTQYFATKFAAPIFFFLSIVFYLFSALSVYASFSSHVSFIVAGLISFLFAYNFWDLAKGSKESE